MRFAACTLLCAFALLRPHARKHPKEAHAHVRPHHAKVDHTDKAPKAPKATEPVHKAQHNQHALLRQTHVHKLPVKYRHPQAKFLAAAAIHSHVGKLDAACSAGIADTTLTYCCQADCGECSDKSDVCAAKATNGRGGTCCPSEMASQPSCDTSMAPCLIPASVRASPTVDELTSAQRHAGTDCNEAIPDEKARHLVATHFVKFAEKSVVAGTETGCDSYTDLESAAAKCDADNKCLGFTASGSGVPACFLQAGTAVEELQTGTTSVYLKKEGSASQTYHFTTGDFGECSKTCGTGTQTRTVGCASSQGETASVGMCSLLVAMNADAQPDPQLNCNVVDC